MFEDVVRCGGECDGAPPHLPDGSRLCRTLPDISSGVCGTTPNEERSRARGRPRTSPPRSRTAPEGAEDW